MTQILDNLSNDPTIGAIGLAIVGAAAGLWLAAAWWTYTDMARRTTFEVVRLGAVAWVLLSTPVLLPLALGTYLLVRPQQTVAERRAQRLFEAMAPTLDDGGCPGCGAMIDPDWHRCPTCETWLASSCRACGQWSPVDLGLCPYCAHEKSGLGTDVAAFPALEPAPAQPAAQAPLVESGWAAATAVARLAAFAGRSGPERRATNRGAREPRRARGTDRNAGSRLGAG